MHLNYLRTMIYGISAGLARISQFSNPPIGVDPVSHLRYGPPRVESARPMPRGYYHASPCAAKKSCMPRPDRSHLGWPDWVFGDARAGHLCARGIAHWSGTSEVVRR